MFLRYMGFFFFFKEKIINLKALGRALDTVTGSEETLCSKGLDHHMGGAGQVPLPTHPWPVWSALGHCFSLAIRISPSSLWEERTKLPIDHYSRAKQTVYFSRFRAIISPGHLLRCVPAFSSHISFCPHILKEGVVPRAAARQKGWRKQSGLAMTYGSFSLLPLLPGLRGIRISCLF